MAVHNGSLTRNRPDAIHVTHLAVTTHQVRILREREGRGVCQLSVTALLMKAVRNWLFVYGQPQASRQDETPGPNLMTRVWVRSTTLTECWFRSVA